MECRNCGKNLRDGAKFCSACGMPTNKPIIRYNDYDECRDIFSDSSMAPVAGRSSVTEVKTEKSQQNYSDRINAMIHNQPVDEPANPRSGYVCNYRPDGYGIQQPVYGDICLQEPEKTSRRKKKADGSSFLDKPLKKIIIDMTAVFMGVVIIAAAILFTVHYIGSSSNAEADSDTGAYYELETEKFTADEAKQVAFAMKYPAVLDMLNDGFKCENRRYAMSGKITQVERYESFATVKMDCSIDGVEFTLMANFDENNVDDTKSLRNGQEACITGVIDLQNINGTCTVYLNYAESDM